MLRASALTVIVAVLTAVVAVWCLKLKLPLGPTLWLLGLFPVVGLLVAGYDLRRAVPDMVFGAIDTGLLTIPALGGALAFGIPGAIAGGVVGDAITDAIAGFFEGGIADWFAKHGIDTSREPVLTALGKMAGCLLGSALVLTIAWLFGISPNG